MQGDAFTSCYKNYYRLILTVAQQCFRGSTETEEVTAEVVRIVWQHRSEGHEPLPSWTYRVLRNVIGNEYRRTHHCPSRGTWMKFAPAWPLRRTTFREHDRDPDAERWSGDRPCLDRKKVHPCVIDVLPRASVPSRHCGPPVAWRCRHGRGDDAGHRPDRRKRRNFRPGRHRDYGRHGIVPSGLHGLPPSTAATSELARVPRCPRARRPVPTCCHIESDLACPRVITARSARNGLPRASSGKLDIGHRNRRRRRIAEWSVTKLATTSSALHRAGFSITSTTLTDRIADPADVARTDDI